METVRINNRGGALWFVLSALIAAPAILIIAMGIHQKNYAWIMGTILLLLSCAALTWGLFGAKRYVLLGEAIEIFYTLRSLRIEWKEVTFIEFEKVESSRKMLDNGLSYLG